MSLCILILIVNLDSMKLNQNELSFWIAIPMNFLLGQIDLGVDSSPHGCIFFVFLISLTVLM